MAARLQGIAVELRRASHTNLTSRLVMKELAKTARPFAPRVRAAILDTPSRGTKPWPPQLPGLRARIAACVQEWARLEGNFVSVGIEVNSALMPDGQHSLPLMLDGRKIWRHPVFGDMENWVGQMSHPFFAQAMVLYGPATRRAVDRAIEELARKLERLG